jgi:serine phosphatase RsbU (regulator of sigma subunit)
MRGFLSEDASSDEEFGAAQSIAEFRIRSFMVVPLATTDGKPLAALQLDTQDVGKKFREDDLKLLTVVANFASVALEKAQVHLALLDREKQQREIELAKQVQLGFLPKTFPQVSGYDFTAFYNAAQTVGGDYYDFIALQDGRVAIMLGDVAGKGVPASLLMAKLSAEARFCIMTQPDPARAINLLNNNLVRGGIGDRFVTLIALVIDSIQNQVTIVNAGHINPLRYRASCCDFNECISEDLIGIPLGVMEGYEYESVTLPLELGDSIIVFTDGVTDAMNPEGVTFELDGVTAALMIEGSLAPGLTPKSIADRVIQAVKKHASGRAQNDDIALVCMGRMIDPHNPGDPGSGPITNTQLDTKRISTLN